MVIKGAKQKRYKRILGLDTSSHSFAFGIIDAGELVKYGEINFKGSNPEDRLASAAKELYAIKDELEVDLVVIEENINVRSIKTGLMLGRFVGISAGIASLGGAPIRTVPPLVWQGYIGNPNLKPAEKTAIKKEFPGKSAGWYQEKGREIRKDKTRQWVKNEFGILIESDNITDAIAITFYSYSQWGTDGS